MQSTCRLLVFSDLDGTLIDHQTYAWDAAQTALKRLDDLSAGLILASSKTAAEISTIRTAMDREKWPSIVENGAGLLPAYEAGSPNRTEYDSIRDVLNDMRPSLRENFRGFGDVSTSELCQMTGLDHEAAEQAQTRCFSEPGVWSGTDTDKKAFLDALEKHGIFAQQGGRFLTLSFGRNKVDQMRDLIATYQPDYTVALGDAPNDLAMLEYADFGVIVANPHRAPLPTLAGEATGKIKRTTAPGPEGWNRAILDLIDHLELE